MEQWLKFPSFLCFFFFFFSHFLLYTLLAETQDKKTMGNNILKVTITRKMKFPRLPSFWYWTIADIENLEVSESFFILIFGSIRNSKSKNQKNDLQQEKCNFKMRFEKKDNFRGL